MKFFLNKIEKEKLNKLIDTFFYNNQVANFLNNEVINEEVYEEIIKDYDIKELKIDEYINDEYFRNIVPNEIKDEEYEIKYEKYRSNQCFLYDDITVDKNDFYVIKNHIGYFNKEYKYLTIQRKNVIWMSLNPHEINTMKTSIIKKNETIYVFGLGLGYYPYLISPYASKIVIIENDEKIINLFKKYLLPKFKYKEKIEIIKSDAFEYAKKLKTNDNVFIDLWHNQNDGIINFVRFKKELGDSKNIKFWINNSLIQAYRNIVINLIIEEYSNQKINYQKSYNKIDEITNNLHYYLLDKEIKTYEDIKELLSDESINKLITQV